MSATNYYDYIVPNNNLSTQNIQMSSSNSKQLNGLKFRCEILVGNFESEHISVQLNEFHELTIEARKEPRRNDNNSPLNSIGYFKRTIKLPEHALPETVTCFLERERDSNLLTVEALLRDDATINDSYVERSNSVNRRESSLHRSRPDFSPAYHKKIDSIDNENAHPRYSRFKSKGFLRYKFDLKEYESDQISISVRDRKILEVLAKKQIIDSNGLSNTNQFKHEISLPENVELHKIKNCFDENDGTLSLEIPLKQSNENDVNNPNSPSRKHSFVNKTNSNPRLNQNGHTNTKPARTKDSSKLHVNESYSQIQNGKSDPNNKYLEMTFNLFDLTFENCEVFKNEENKNVLLIKAIKRSDSYEKLVNRQYYLPDWVALDRVNAFKETNLTNNKMKNIVKIQLPIIE
jgi:HSP20 family molecular chaperone IbpA